jgi:TonB family protein
MTGMSARILLAVVFALLSGGAAETQVSYRMAEALKEKIASCPTDMGRYRDADPEYPPGAIRNREEGVVVVGICPSPSGHAESVEILKSSGKERLDLATAVWACGKRHQPARAANDNPIRSCGSVVEIGWRLSEFDIPDHVLEPRIDEAPAPVPVSR